jgi:integrase
MWWLIALRGLRRGEAAGLRWVDVDLDGRTVTLNQQRLAYGRTVAVGPPKTAASRRTIALDRVTVTVLRAHRRRQEKERGLAGKVWQDTGYVFTTTDGRPLHPDYLTRRFRSLVEESGLPPVRRTAGPPTKSAATEASPRPQPLRPRRSRRRKSKKQRGTHMAPARHPQSTNDRAGR